jgi:hypothetical protein
LAWDSWPEVSLTDVKTKVAENRAKLAKGEDPRKPIAYHRFRGVVPLWIAKQRLTWISGPLRPWRGKRDRHLDG